MKRICIIVTCVFTSLISLAGVLAAAQTNATVVLTNECQVSGYLVSQSASNVVISFGGGQRMTFASSEISSLNLTEIPSTKSPVIQPVSGGTSNAATRIMLALTNGSLMAGVLVSQSSSNFVVSTGAGQNTNIARSKVNWFELQASPAVATQPTAPAAHSIAAEFNKPHSESEMRAMLHTPEGAALLKSICEQYIGSGTDPDTKAATEYYFKTVQEFADGKLGIADIQSLAQSAMGELNEHPQGTNGGPQAAQLNAYKQILQGFISQPTPTPANPVQ
jgi:hypothetical protein